MRRHVVFREASEAQLHHPINAAYQPVSRLSIKYQAQRTLFETTIDQ